MGFPKRYDGELRETLFRQLSYYLSIQTRTKAYFMKGKGLLLSKLPRATSIFAWRIPWTEESG